MARALRLQGLPNGAIARGSIFSIFGRGLGPSTGQSAPAGAQINDWAITPEGGLLLGVGGRLLHILDVATGTYSGSVDAVQPALQSRCNQWTPPVRFPALCNESQRIRWAIACSCW